MKKLGTLLVLLFFYTSILIAQTKVDSILQQLEQANNDSVRYELYVQLTTKLLFNDPLKAKHYLELAREIAQREDWEKRLAVTFIYDGHIANYLGSNAQSLELYTDAYNYSESIQYYDGMAYASAQLIDKYLELDQTDKALEYGLRSLMLIEKSKEEYTPREYQNRTATIYFNLGNIYNHRNAKDTARLYFEKAILIEDWNNSSRIYVLNTLSGIYLENNETKKAFEILEQARQVLREDYNVLWDVKVSLSLGEYFLHVQQFDSCDFYTRKALDIALERKLAKQIMTCYSVLSEMYHAKSEFRQAYEMQKVYKRISDSLFQERSVKNLANLESRMVYEQEKKEILYKQQQQQYRFFIIALVLLALLILVTLLFFVQRSRSRQKTLEKKQLQQKNELLNKDLLLANQDLTAKVMYMVRRNKLIEDVSRELLDLKDQLGQDIRRKVVRIISNLQEASNNEMLKEFEARFTKIHPSFFEGLRNKHPELTANERRLCAYLKMDLTTKEIAYFAGILPSSIDVARSRLRKKMNITNSDISLEDYLAEF